MPPDRVASGAIQVLSLQGELDAHTASELEAAIQKCQEDQRYQIIVNGSNLQYISSAGLGVFMSYIEEFKDQNIKMILFGMSDKVANTFEILGLNELLKIGKDKAQAKRMLNEL